MKFVTRIIILPALLIGGYASRGDACPIPVYRYALEFWESDPYRVTVFHRGPLTPEQEALADTLIQATTDTGVMANVDVNLADVAGELDAVASALFQREAPAELPWVVTRFPVITGREETVLSGPLTEENLNLMLDSPARREVAEKLVAGTTSVWVFLESGNRQKDREAFATLEAELRRLEQTLSLPDPELWLGTAAGQDTPDIKFEIVRVSRDDPREAHLVKMLMHTEVDLRDFREEPMVFPMYGRGIALWAILGKGINSWNITEAAEFLTGPCSCEVKMLNPGVELLIAKDWGGEITRIADEMLRDLTTIADFESREEEVKRQLAAATEKRFPAVPDEEPEPERVIDVAIDKLLVDEEREPGPEEKREEAVAEAPEEVDKKATAGPELEPRIPPEAEGPQRPPLIILLAGVVAVVLLAGFALFKLAGRKRS